MPEIKRVTVDSIKDFLEQIKEIKKKQNYTECLFRGLSNSNWEIMSTVNLRFGAGFYYENKFGHDQDIEREIRYNQTLITDYRHKFLSKEKDSEIAQTDLGILAQIRHLGAASSLIDFTKDPLVALWFACNEEIAADEKIKDGVVYTLGIKNSDDFIHIYQAEQLKQHSIREIFGSSYSSNPYQGSCFYWEPGDLNERIPAQSSYFVIGSKNFHAEVIKNEVIVIDAQAKDRILDELSDVYNINRLRLFPDLAGFVEANGKDVPIRLREEVISEIRFYTESISNVENNLQVLVEQDQVRVKYELGMLFFDRGTSKLNFGDVEEGNLDIGKGEELLKDARGLARESLETIIKDEISFDRSTGHLEEVAGFVGEGDDSKERRDKCLGILFTLFRIEDRLEGYEAVDVIANTLLKISPDEYSEIYFMKATNLMKLAVSQKKGEERIKYLHKSIKYIDEEGEEIHELHKELRKGLLYSHMVKCVRPSDKRFSEYRAEEIKCYRNALTKNPKDPFAMTTIGSYIIKDLEMSAGNVQESDKPKRAEGYLEALEYIDNAIERMPKDLKLRLNRGKAIYELAKLRELKDEELDRALKDFKLFEREAAKALETDPIKEKIGVVEDMMNELKKIHLQSNSIKDVLEPSKAKELNKKERGKALKSLREFEKNYIVDDDNSTDKDKVLLKKVGEMIEEIERRESN